MAENHILLLLLLLTIFFFTIYQPTVAVTNPDLEALTSFKTSLQTPKALSSWNESVPLCNWVGVTCQLGRVTSLALNSASLSGHIPPSLSSLTHLRELSLSQRKIPPEIGNLKTLITLDLSSNALTGKIPPEFTGLSSLKFVDLSNNLLSGEIFLKLHQLISLDISKKHHRSRAD
ncbi:Leucine-rich repeat receptor protein kinase EMS1 [Linum grandiflorum]